MRQSMVTLSVIIQDQAITTTLVNIMEIVKLINNSQSCTIVLPVKYIVFVPSVSSQVFTLTIQASITSMTSKSLIKHIMWYRNSLSKSLPMKKYINELVENNKNAANSINASKNKADSVKKTIEKAFD